MNQAHTLLLMEELGVVFVLFLGNGTSVNTHLQQSDNALLILDLSRALSWNILTSVSHIWF
jgi:glycerol uptake facilitator-like aquaporin